MGKNRNGMKYACMSLNPSNLKMMTEQQSLTISGRHGDIHFGKKLFYWAQALILFAVVIAAGMLMLDWCINLNLFWNAR